MFGIYRYILANIVAVAHLSNLIEGTVLAPNAVYAFYILSGFLMTSILNRIYGFDLKGIKTYLLNRILRIYPTYWIVFLTGFAFLIISPSVSGTINKAITFPNSLGSWFYNILLFDFKSLITGNLPDVRVIPPAWALGIEIFFYFAIPFWGKNKNRAFLWFIASGILTLFLLVTRQSIDTRYYSVFAASLPFSIGSLMYYYLAKIKISHKTAIKISCVGMLLLLINAVLVKATNGFNLLIYSYLGISTFTIVGLSKIKSKKIDKKITKLDKFLGSLSYPIYLIHWVSGIIISLLFFDGTKPSQLSLGGKVFFILSLILAHILAILITKYFESWVQKTRDKIRGIKMDTFSPF